MNEDEEGALVSRSLLGDRQSFERLVERYQKPVFNVAYRMLNHYEDARDVTQTVFLKAFQSLKDFAPGHRFFSWIYRIAINESINLRKSRRACREVDERMPDGRTSQDGILQSTELSHEIQSALMLMEPDQRALIVLRHFHYCSYQDIGEILNISVSMVKSRLFTARNQLREILSRKGVL